MSVHLDFPDSSTAPVDARGFVRDELESWGLSELIDVAELLVSEVVTNAVRHARTGGRIALSRIDDGVRIEVLDRGTGVPSPRRAGPSDPTGRGLAIVDSLARSWGVEETETDGKTVWFELGIRT